MRPGRLLLAAALAAAVLHAAGMGSELSGPPAEWHALGQWFDSRPAPISALTLVRLAGEAAALYVVAVVGAWTIGRTCRSRWLVAGARTLAVPALRRTLQLSAGAGLLAGLSIPSAGAHSPAAPPAAVAADDSESVAVMQPRTSTARMSAIPAPRHPTSESDRYVVERGDSFWSIAEDLVARADSNASDPHDVAPRWRALIEANRHRLADPSNPDLLYPGQVLVIPAPA